MVTSISNSYLWKFNSSLFRLPHSKTLCSVSNLRFSSVLKIQNSALSCRLVPYNQLHSSCKIFTASYSTKYSQTIVGESNSMYKNSLVLVRSPFSHIVVCHAREFSTSASRSKTGSFFSRIFRKKIPTSRLTRSGYDLYSGISKNTDILHFFKILSLEDTFFSWLLVMQLQVWLVSVRLMAEGDEGKVARNALINAMWEDTQAKLVDLGVRSTSKKTDLEEMNSHFQSSLLSYDEGLLGSDKELAGAVWRRLIRRDVRDNFSGMSKDGDEKEEEEDSGDESSLKHIQEPTADPLCLEAMVCYIRKQMQLLDNINRDDLLMKGQVVWCKPEMPQHSS